MSEPKTLTAATFLDQPKRVLIIGDSGSGKTHLLGTFPKPIFVADFDGGLETLTGTDGIVYQTYEGQAGWRDFRKELDTWCLNGPQYGCKTFAIDSLSLMSDAIIKAILHKHNKPQGPVGIDNWGDAIRTVKDVLSDLAVRMKCHTVVTAHLQVEKDELLGGLLWQPAIYGKELPGKVPAYFSEVYLTTAVAKVDKPTEYKLQVTPDMRVKFVKSRMNKDAGVFSQFEEPNFEKLMLKAHNKLKETK